ncbi:MAG: DUF159 family protein [Cellvibrionaceae bacterium]|nr:DUF159 family protein [Cellvibrionaceae bacterium]
MCGRLNVTDSSLSQWVSETLGVDFNTTTNTDLRPTDNVDVLVAEDNDIGVCKTRWGIKPDWSKRVIINAQGETVAEKKTFKQAFHNHRCLVPCSGWYEWRAEAGPRKTKYQFVHANRTPLLMAGIYFNREFGAELVTLTTQPNAKCAQIHNRMPVLIEVSNAQSWLQGSRDDALSMIGAVDNELISIERMNGIAASDN